MLDVIFIIAGVCLVFFRLRGRKSIQSSLQLSQETSFGMTMPGLVFLLAVFIKYLDKYLL